MSKLNTDGKGAIRIGHYTKNAIESFENNIVNQKDYLEKVDKELKKEEEPKSQFK
ncbi:hypothetical protein KQI89_00215 [Clostridium sp. MSJ-4]|uniref:Uncharacterized protein n=1 Tax=Clostridium simiarum TaxID=2841506 RepID=A0ABS6EVC5_9CLOT|nr:MULTISPECIES: hypothetical protein [Clostridium]MBU5590179.1 hypothetical protein [Clostridium simiarum]